MIIALTALNSPPNLMTEPSLIATYLAGQTTTSCDELQRCLAQMDFITLLNAIDQTDPELPVFTKMRLYQDRIRANEGNTQHLFVAWFNLGLVRSRAGDTKAAIAAYAIARDLDSVFAPAAVNLGLLLEATGQAHAALKIWEDSFQANDAHTTLLNHKARLLEQLGRLDEAEATLYVSLLTNTTQPDALQHRLHIRQKTCYWPVLANKIPGVPAAAPSRHSGPHEEQHQYDGLTMVIPCLDRRFVFIVDDWNWERVRRGTFSAIDRLGLKLLFSAEVRTTLNNQNSTFWLRRSDWHNGYFIAVPEQDDTRLPRSQF